MIARVYKIIKPEDYECIDTPVCSIPHPWPCNYNHELNPGHVLSRHLCIPWTGHERRIHKVLIKLNNNNNNNIYSAFTRGITALYNKLKTQRSIQEDECQSCSSHTRVQFCVLDHIYRVGLLILVLNTFFCTCTCTCKMYKTDECLIMCLCLNTIRQAN